MKRLFYTYFPIIISVLFLFCYGTAMRFIFVSDDFTVSDTKFTLFIIIWAILTFISAITITVEMILFIVKAAKQKNALWIVLLYMLNVFVIPYYNIRYVLKLKNYKKINYVYVIFSIIVFILGIVVSDYLIQENSYHMELKENQVSNFVTVDGKVAFTFQGNYLQKPVGEYDLYVSNANGKDNFGAFCYDLNVYDVDPEVILQNQINQIIETRSNVAIIDTDAFDYGDRIVTTHIYSGMHGKVKNIYRFSTITFTDDPDYFVYTIQVVLASDYDARVAEFMNVLFTARLNDSDSLNNSI